ncbi:MAG: hypothetical protein AAF208_14515 [Cyanobacteria bacterium P01_A01_bin.45]
MGIETDKEFWIRQIAEWHELVRKRELKKNNFQNEPSVNNDVKRKPV